MSSSKKKILILSANPKNMPPIRLEEEKREIEEGLRLSKHSHLFSIKTKPAVRIKDIRRSLLDYKPHVVHFMGHGDQEGIFVENETGMSVQINLEALSELLDLSSKEENKIECVILNACYSEKQAKAIGKHIDCVIGMRKEITDKAAIEFAVGFYDALGAGEDYEKAFKFGRNAIKLFNLAKNEDGVPILFIGKIKEGKIVKNKIDPDDRPKTVAIRSFKHPAHDFENQVDEMLCLCDHFQGRLLVKGTWEGVIQEIKEFIARTIKAHRRYNLYLPLHSSLVFMVGRTLDPKCGAEINIFQSSSPSAFKLWRFNQLDYLDDFAPWIVEESIPGNNGDELAAAISIVHNTIGDVQTYIENSDVPISRIIHLDMYHTNPRAIKNENQAYTAAYQAVVILRDKFRQSGASRLNLFLAAPNVFTFLLGQQSRLLGEITLFEYNLDSGKKGDYSPAFTLTP